MRSSAKSQPVALALPPFFCSMDESLVHCVRSRHAAKQVLRDGACVPWCQRALAANVRGRPGYSLDGLFGSSR